MIKVKSLWNSKVKARHSIVQFLFSLTAAAILFSVSFGFASKRVENVPDFSSAPGSGASNRPSPSDVTVWIKRSDGAQLCVKGSEASLVSGSAELQAARIKVLEAKKGTDGKMHAQVCGGPRGSTNNYLIDRDKLQSALSLGYAEVISSKQ